MSDIESKREDEPQDSAPSISLRKSIGIYVLFLALLVASVILANTTAWFSGLFVVILYFAFGFLLNRIVLRRLVEWHPVYNTIGNVSSAKLSAFTLWPAAYFFLFFRLIVNKIL